MEFDFLKPVDDEILIYINGLTSQQLGSKIVLHTNEQFPDLNKIKIAVIGVLENRGDKKAVSDVDLIPLRKELYGLLTQGDYSVLMQSYIHGESVEDAITKLKGA